MGVGGPAGRRPPRKARRHGASTPANSSPSSSFASTPGGATCGAQEVRDGFAATPTEQELLNPGRRSSCHDGLGRAFRSLYFWACLTYLAYTLQELAVDYCSVLFPDHIELLDNGTGHIVPTSVSDIRCSSDGDSQVNQQSIALAAQHLINGLMFMFCWWGWFKDRQNQLGWCVIAAILLPDVLNVMEAALYVRSSTWYGSASLACRESYRCKDYYYIFYIETAAAVIELFAAAGWVWTWWYTFEPGPGRGFTYKDPDCLGSVLLVVSSVMYAIYQAQILNNPDEFGENRLYVQADILYAIGALFYLAGSLRDHGLLACIPLVSCQPLQDEEPLQLCARTPTLACAV